MNVFLDTNVLFPTIVFPNGVCWKAYEISVTSPFSAFTSDYVVEELCDVICRFDKSRIANLETFFRNAGSKLSVIATPTEPLDEETLILDEKDRPILRAALAGGANILVTGDKHFLSVRKHLAIEVMSPAEFVQHFSGDGALSKR